MKKIVINSCYGGFGLSPEALLLLYKRGYQGDGFIVPVEEYFVVSKDDFCFETREESLDDWHKYLKDEDYSSSFLTVFTPCEKFVLSGSEIERDNKFLVEVVEGLGKRASGLHAKLKIVEIPDDVEEWVINEYDGLESISEKHRSWE